MTRFGVYSRRDTEPGYLLDVQSDLLSHLDTRLIVPLIPMAAGRRIAVRLNPVFDIAGAQHMMYTQFASAMPLSELGRRVMALADGHDAIMGALDVLLTGV